MKKLIHLLTASLLVFCSCTNDNSESVILPKAITIVTAFGTEKYVISYNGDKIVNITNKWGRLNYFYTGDFITKIERVNTDSTNAFEFSYTDNQLTSVDITRYASNTISKSKEIYSYNSDGTILRKFYEIDNVGNLKLDEIWRYTISNGNLTKHEFLNADGSVRGRGTMEYDNQKNAFKNVRNLDKLILTGYGFGFTNDGGRNNVIKISSTYMSTYSYKYNNKGYPIEMKRYDGNSFFGTTTYAY